MEKCNWGRAGFNDYGVVKREERNQPPDGKRGVKCTQAHSAEREKDEQSCLLPPYVQRLLKVPTTTGVNSNQIHCGSFQPGGKCGGLWIQKEHDSLPRELQLYRKHNLVLTKRRSVTPRAGAPLLQWNSQSCAARVP